MVNAQNAGSTLSANSIDDSDGPRTARALDGARNRPGSVVLDSVSMAYANGNRRSPDNLAVDSLTTTVNQSERFVILGPSGCGKSTLLRAMGGFMKPVGGRILIDDDQVVRPTKERIMVFQESNQLLPWRTVRQNIEFALQRCIPQMNKRDRNAEVGRMLELVHLIKQGDQYPHTLSGGQKQRCAIARSFVSRPSLLLMDEPFGALDAITREALQAELKNLWTELKTTIVFITHDVAEAVALGQRVLVMTGAPGKVRELVDVENSDLSPSQLCEYLRNLLVDEK